MNTLDIAVAIVNPARFERLYRGRYSGFDGDVLLQVKLRPDDAAQREFASLLDISLSEEPRDRNPRLIYLGSSESERPAADCRFEFLGYDVGHYESEYNAYSLIANFLQGNSGHGFSLNDHLLLDSEVDAHALTAKWNAFDGDKEEFWYGEELIPIKIYAIGPSRGHR